MEENHSANICLDCDKDVFLVEPLNKLNATDVVLDFSRICYGYNVGENDIALICYEKPTDFCHRHLVSDWLNKNGFKCDEYLFNK